ncbi:oxidoreductase [Streptomyces triticiradicis]|uniref:SDR family NAD(P)-dependent oxidoreductase n=1 Tax=Streptomyces triticiradicis TaxID=2651189 RepID=A0A7J5DJD9_9ACTN|nr:oxidoreductase [Streptomyces triticiradicis]KAB1988818.1 SDR family NAD(P)-dependent oxidoreductase [Streptomyces triticiradicis]
MTTSVLITGTSSGIGRATALRLARRPELTVYATARHSGTLTDLADAGARILPLDVTDETSMKQAVEAVEAEHGSVGVLVNNAGYGEYGTVEETGLDGVRRQFETNVFGLSRMTQLVLPGMRQAGRGRIVNVGSMGGRIVFPVGGYYHASKYAVEALSDALRFEVAPFGVKVSLIEPGLIRTSFGDTAADTLAESAAPTGPYAALNTAAEQQMARSYDSKALSAPPETVAEVIERAVTAARPKARYVVTPAAKALIHIRRLLGARVFDAYLRMQFRTTT